MLCSDTAGQLPAIHIPKEVIDLAQELQPMIETIRLYGAEGSITLKIQHGFVPVIEYMFRRFRNKKSVN